ncbi:hypothetical protein MYSE111917_15080 [Mycobacterium senriense]|jgi:hypothetical protein|uniref:Uncharacterized protein n=1 Tax=Mycobacterium senriense TaxID=2775496 RepID=A0ABN6IGX0_9MYCO|nr:hypothetical protein [Mycobacterium senriense]BCZ22545.1 hypothetical protein MTY59_24000 [Mycobacterium senriense]
MAVTVTLRDGAIERYMRFGDAYRKHSDGTLDVIRSGVKRPHTYARDEWSDVSGDEKSWKKFRFWD